MSRGDWMLYGPWSVGDRLWTSMEGSGTVLQLRNRGCLAEGLVALDRPLDKPIWMVLGGLDRPRQSAPVRDSLGLQRVVIGQAVWHVEWGSGSVTGVCENTLDDVRLSVATIAFENKDGSASEHEITLGSGALRARAPPSFHAEIVACEAGWIDLDLSAGVQLIELSLSAVFDPMPQLLVWLEAIALGVQECGFDLDEEGHLRTLHARQDNFYDHARSIPAVQFSVCAGGLGQGGRLLFSVQVERHVLVGSLYRCFRDFAVTRYDPREWERAMPEADGFADSGHGGMPLRLWRSETIERWLIDTGSLTVTRGFRDNAAMKNPTIDVSPLRKALAMLSEALVFWNSQPEGTPLKPHLRSAVIQSFEFTYELSVRLLRRVLIERAEAADRVADLSFNDLLRGAADAGLMADAAPWREWREMRNATSHAYDEAKAQALAVRASAFAADAAALLAALEASLAS